MPKSKKKKKQKDGIIVDIEMDSTICPYQFPPKMKNQDKYDLFARWCAIQTLGVRFNEKQRRTIGLTDDDDEELLTCQNQNEFAKKFKMSIDTLSKWKKQFGQDFNMRKLWYCERWLGDRAPVVFQSWIAGIASKKSADLIKLYLQYKMNWAPKTEVEHSGKLSLIEIVKGLEDE